MKPLQAAEAYSLYVKGDSPGKKHRRVWVIQGKGIREYISQAILQSVVGPEESCMPPCTAERSEEKTKRSRANLLKCQNGNLVFLNMETVNL